MNNTRWTWFAIGYECCFAYLVALCVYQLASLFMGSGNILGVIVSAAIVAGMLYLLFRPYKEATKLTANVMVK